MKEDNLEKFVRNNRDKFDNLEPSAEIWGRIDTPKTKKISWVKISVSVAATILLFLGVYFIYNQSKNKKQQYVQSPVENKIVIKKEKDSIPQITIEPEEKKLAENKTVPVKTKKTITKNVVEQKTNELNELAEVKEYYTNEIEIKQEEILNCIAYDPEIKTEIQNEFTPLDAAFNELKKDLNDNIDNSQIMDAMIQNYRTKLEILNDIKNQLCSRE
jgi:low affinity Fe/Cu permease